MLSLCSQRNEIKNSVVLAEELLEIILKKDDDCFGFLGFDFKEKYCKSLISMTNCKFLKMNQEGIFKDLYNTFA